MKAAERRLVAWRRQAACDASLGFLLFLMSDILLFLRHVWLELRDVGAMANRHTDTDLYGKEG